MNIFNKLLMQAVLLPAPLYRRMGADTGLVRVILQTKLTLDDRTPNTVQQVRRHGKQKPTNMATLGSMFISGLMGFLYLFAFALGTDTITQFTLYFSMFFVLLASMLIADFTTVLLDVRDNMIILTRPVNDATFLTARLLHILIHLTKMVLPMCLPGAAYIAYNFGAGLALWFLAPIVLLVLFTIFFINALYLVAMRFVAPQKFQAVISYVQVVLAVLIYASYQVVPILMNRYENLNLQISNHWFAPLLPPFWFASIWQWLHGPLNSIGIIGLVLGFLVPLVAIWIVVRFLAKSFIRQLTLSGNKTAVEITPVAAGKMQGSGFAEKIANIFTPSAGLQRAGFLFTWKMSGRSRDFRIQVLPSIGYILVFGAISIYRNIQSTGSSLRSSKFLLFAFMYFGAYVLIVALGQMKFSEKWKASWVYYAAPVTQPGPLIVGGFKAMAVKFYAPLATLIIIAGLAIFGPSLLPNLLLGLSNQLLIAAMLVYITQRQLPFSQPQQTKSKGSNILQSILVLGFTALLATGHYLLYTYTAAVLLCNLLSIAALWMVLNSILQTSWEKVTQAEM